MAFCRFCESTYREQSNLSLIRQVNLEGEDELQRKHIKSTKAQRLTSPVLSLIYFCGSDRSAK